MKQTVRCLPCYLNACINCMDAAELSPDLQYDILYSLLPELDLLSKSGTPCENASRVLLKCYSLMGAHDPFEAQKRESNALASALLPKLSQIIDGSHDRLYMALKLAAAGNIIDLAIFDSVDMLPAIDHCIKNEFSIGEYPEFKTQLAGAKKVLIVGDNSGEIVFDTLLVRELLAVGKKVTYMVKDAPIMNDSTAVDAEQSGMSALCPIVTTGQREMGICVSTASPEALSHFESADIIISKGQANFEGLDGAPFAKGRIFFLLKLKCASICSYTGGNLGDVVFFRKDK